jgi:hypothetical protein
MNLVLTRRWFTPKCTIGTLDIDGNAECYILEDVEREVKIPKETCIPLGTYMIVIDFSNRFQRRLPRLLDVPQFTGIRIHPGNMAKDTEGCLLPGVEKYEDSVGHSVIAFNNLFGKMLLADAKQESISIEVKH